MPKIREIQIRNLDIPPVPDWLMNYPQSIPPVVPVTQNIGIPIVDMPGCVEAHEANNGSKTLQSDDPNGTLTFCDGNMPSFNPINFEPNQTLPTQKPKVDTRQPKAPEAPDLPIPKTPPATAKVDCPTASQQAKEPVGTYLEGFRKKVTGYQLIGNQCVQQTEKVPLPEQIIAGLPSPGTVMTTGGIAVVATASALMAKPLADILLKVIKPTVKKVMKKIAKIRGKQEEILSVTERRDLQRERTEAIRALKKVLKPKG
jgi:hypothetical protein